MSRLGWPAYDHTFQLSVQMALSNMLKVSTPVATILFEKSLKHAPAWIVQFDPQFLNFCLYFTQFWQLSMDRHKKFKVTKSIGYP